jgi:hypothetical protein
VPLVASRIGYRPGWKSNIWMMRLLCEALYHSYQKSDEVDWTPTWIQCVCDTVAERGSPLLVNRLLALVWLGPPRYGIARGGPGSTESRFFLFIPELKAVTLGQWKANTVPHASDVLSKTQSLTVLAASAQI